MSTHLTTPSQRVAIVTGGSRGIGRQAAVRLASDGHAVVLTYLDDRDEADVAVAEITGAGGQAVAVQADVADENAMSAVFALAQERFGGIDVVVNSAGRLAKATVADFDLTELDALHRTNIRGTFVVDQLAARTLRPGGTIVNLSSSVVKLGFPTYAGYSASKGAVEAITTILARELRGRDVTVNAVAPGPTATDFFFAANDQEGIERAKSQSPLGRMGEPEDIAEVVAFLASREGHWVNGQVLQANGGVI